MQEYFSCELGHCKEVVLSDSSGMPDDLWNLSTTSTHTSKFCKIGPWWSTIFKISPSLLAITCVPNHFPVLYISNIVHLVLQYCNWCNWDGMRIYAGCRRRCGHGADLWNLSPLLCNDAAWTIFKIFQVPAFVDVCTHISQFYQFPLVHLLLQCLQVKAGCKWGKI